MVARGGALTRSLDIILGTFRSPGKGWAFLKGPLWLVKLECQEETRLGGYDGGAPEKQQWPGDMVPVGPERGGGLVCFGVP